MKNPFRSEADAFRFVWLTIGFFALIVIGSLIDRWLGLAVFAVLAAVALWWLFRREEQEPPVKQTPAASPPDEHRILVVANETVGGPELLREIRERSEGKNAGCSSSARSQLAAPALGVGRGPGARERAGPRREPRLMRAVGLDADGEIGDGDPIQAIEDAVRTFRPDELVISTHPAGRSHWLERGVVDKARERFELPVTHVVVDLDTAVRDDTDRS